MLNTTTNHITAQKTATPTAERLPDEALDGLFPRYFGLGWELTEGLVYSSLRDISASGVRQYDWTFYRLSNGGLFMAPANDEGVSVVRPEGSMVSAQAAGIAACLIAFGCMVDLGGPNRPRFVALWNNLYAFAVSHEAADWILSTVAG